MVNDIKITSIINRLKETVPVLVLVKYTKRNHYHECRHASRHVHAQLVILRCRYEHHDISGGGGGSRVKFIAKLQNLYFWQFFF